MTVDAKVGPIVAVYVDAIVITGLPETCRDFHAAVVTKIPPTNPGELTWYTSCDFKRDWGLGALVTTQNVFVDGMLTMFGVN